MASALENEKNSNKQTSVSTDTKIEHLTTRIEEVEANAKAESARKEKKMQAMEKTGNLSDENHRAIQRTEP